MYVYIYIYIVCTHGNFNCVPPLGDYTTGTMTQNLTQAPTDHIISILR